MKVLITGGRGLLGSAVVREIQKSGHECVVVQRTPCHVPGISEFLDDLIAPTKSEQWIKGVEVVVHLAAKVGIVGSYQEFFDSNVLATRKLLEMAKENGVQRFIFASSPSVAHTGNALIGVGAHKAEPAHVRGA